MLGDELHRPSRPPLHLPPDPGGEAGPRPQLHRPEPDLLHVTRHLRKGIRRRTAPGTNPYFVDQVNYAHIYRAYDWHNVY